MTAQDDLTIYVCQSIYILKSESDYVVDYGINSSCTLSLTMFYLSQPVYHGQLFLSVFSPRALN